MIWVLEEILNFKFEKALLKIVGNFEVGLAIFHIMRQPWAYGKKGGKIWLKNEMLGCLVEKRQTCD